MGAQWVGTQRVGSGGAVSVPSASSPPSAPALSSKLPSGLGAVRYPCKTPGSCGQSELSSLTWNPPACLLLHGTAGQWSPSWWERRTACRAYRKFLVDVPAV